MEFNIGSCKECFIKLNFKSESIKTDSYEEELICPACGIMLGKYKIVGLKPRQSIQENLNKWYLLQA